jgi:hypothetical protein
MVRSPRRRPPRRRRRASPEISYRDSRIGYVALSPRGQILVSQSDDNLIKVFAPNGAVSTVGRNGGGPGEFQRVTRIGFLRDSLWALDPSLSRVNIYGPDLKYVRTFAEPLSGMQSRGEEPLTYYTQAVLSNGDLRAIASFRPNSSRPSWATGVDSGAKLLVRISPEGKFKQRLTVIAASQCIILYTFEKGSGSTTVPFCPTPVSTDWDGGVGVATVEVEGDIQRATSYRVTVVDEQGTTRFVRSIHFTPIPVSKTALDSVARRRAEVIKSSPAKIAAAMPNPKPFPTRPPIRRVVLGRDYSVWLEEQTTTTGHRWLVLDPKGSTVGVVTLPQQVKLYVAELGTIWGTVADADDLQGIVRYRVGR